MVQKKIIEQLFRRYYRPMVHLARILLHDDKESEDVVSDIFLELMNKNIVPEGDTALAFLITSVRNRCLNIIRNQNIQQRILHLYLLDDKLDEHEAEEKEERIRQIRLVIDKKLSDDNRRILLEHYQEHLTYHEIAFREGISEVTVYKHLKKSLDTIKELVKR
ncbi:MAG: sigma-70 family RNA polymerase sigma factor [Prevotella sp.]|nr:sigma-70 family RNA polymerase sigma factor [Prevotella sp.]